MNEANVQRNFKDTIFRMLFKDKENLLSLYNALNGTDYQPERQTLKLSDAYEKWQENPELELTVTMYNINYGCNEEIMEACKTLKEYTMYVERVRTYAKQMPLTEAVENAIDECIEEGILADFLRENKAEAIKVSIYEYDEELHFKTLRDEGYESGYAEGHESGFTEGHEVGLEHGESRLNKLYATLIESDRLDDLKRATQDKAYQEQLMIELMPEEI